jgi:hypothetical protein
MVPSRESNSGLPNSKPTHYPLSYAAPCQDTLQPAQLSRTLMIFKDHRRLPVIVFSVKITASGPLKRDTGRSFKFVEANKKFTIKYHNSKLAKYLKVTSANTKIWYWFNFVAFNKISIS